VPAAGHVLAMAVKGEKRAVRLLPVPRLDWLSLRVEVDRQVCLADSAGQLLEALAALL
jgi:hypothetical protein